MMELELKARHFKWTSYSSPCRCAIAKAAKETFGVKKVQESIMSLTVNDRDFEHDCYDSLSFAEDKEKARKMKFSDETIRTIILNEKQ